MPRFPRFCQSFSLGCVFLCAFSNCQRAGDIPKPESEGGADNRSRILTALERLMRDEDDGAFVIFEEKATRKFVQFAGSAHEELLLDLPFATLDENEITRAISYFETMGVRDEDPYEPVASDEDSIRRQRVFQMTLGRDVETATNIVMQVFQRVLPFPKGL